MPIIVYMLVMALVTYAIRMLPFAFIKKKVKSKFIRSFLYYVPYAVLSAMTFPAIFYSTGDMLTAVIGSVVALVLAFFRLPLIVVALAAVASAFLSVYII